MITQIDFKNETLFVKGELGFVQVMNVYKQSVSYFNPSKQLTIDLSAVEHVDSSALTLICEWIRLSRKRQMSVQFVNTPAQLLSVAQVCGVKEIFKL